MMIENGHVSRSRGLSQPVLWRQIQAMRLLMLHVLATWADYEIAFVEALTQLNTTYALHGAVFGDIDLDNHWAWEEKVSAAVGLEASLLLLQCQKAVHGSTVSLPGKALKAACRARI